MLPVRRIERRLSLFASDLPGICTNITPPQMFEIPRTHPSTATVFHVADIDEVGRASGSYRSRFYLPSGITDPTELAQYLNTNNQSVKVEFKQPDGSKAVSETPRAKALGFAYYASFA